MKIETVPTTRFALFCTSLVVAWFMLSDSASAVGIRDAHERGLIQFSASSRHNDVSTYINNLIGIGARSGESANGQYFGSGNSMPHAVVIDNMDGGSAPGQSVRPVSPIIGPIIGPRPSGVPDGGVTAMLLGAALGALGIARRYLKT
jgi:VPDSG-CTERM motif